VFFIYFFVCGFVVTLVPLVRTISNQVLITKIDIFKMKALNPQ